MSRVCGGADRCIVGRWHHPTREGRGGKLAPRELVVPVPRGKASRDACAVSFLLLPHLRLRGLAFQFPLLLCSIAVRPRLRCLPRCAPAGVRACAVVGGGVPAGGRAAASFVPCRPAPRQNAHTTRARSQILSTVRATISLCSYV